MLSKKRIDWIDLSKGFAILLMVMGHTSIPLSLSKYIWSFHMPLFFFVSGMFLRKDIDSDICFFYKKKINSLLIPYVFFTIIVFWGYYGSEYFRPYELYMGWEGYALWFVPVLFLSEILVFYINKICNKCIFLKKNVFWFSIFVLLYILSFTLSYFNIKLPYKIDCVPLCSIFVLSGYFYSCIKDKIKYNWVLIIVSLCISVVLSQVLPKTGLGRNYIGYGVPNIINAFIGIYTCFGISILIDKLNCHNKFIKWCGRNSIFIMAFSQLYNYWILILLNKLSLSRVIALPLRYVLLFAFIYLSAILLTKYLPTFVGRKK